MIVVPFTHTENGSQSAVGWFDFSAKNIFEQPTDVSTLNHNVCTTIYIIYATARESATHLSYGW